MNEQFRELIQVALGNRQQMERPLSSGEWQELYGQAQKQALLGICMYGISKLPKEQKPEGQLYWKWLAVATQIQQQNRKVDEALKELAFLFDEHHVKYAVVKGQVASRYYPDPSFRQAGDIDFFVDRKDFARAKQLITAEWGATYEGTARHHHIEFEYKGIPFEQHHALIRLYDKQNDNYWDRLVEKLYAIQKIDAVAVSTLSPTLHSLYIFLHLYHHLLELGVGLRQFCDWAAILHACTHDIDHKAIRQHLKVLGMERAYRACGAILINNLGLSAEEFTYELNARDYRYAKRILEVVDYRGNMGKYNLKGGQHGMWHNLEAAGIKIAHFMKFMPLAPKFSCKWLLHEIKRKVEKKLR